MALPTLTLKTYQTGTLAALRAYLSDVVRFSDAGTAFYKATKNPYVEAPGLPGLPYVCLRIPTGGGKTILAAHSVGIATDGFLRVETPTVLWFVPSHAIRDQTLDTLRDRAHPNRRALADRFGENVRVMTVQEALYAKRADYDGGAVVIVATLQAFRVDQTEGRKVYEANGELMDHFTGLDPVTARRLAPGPGGDPVPSLANVLSLHRPMVIVDEAHNARTELSFDTLARLSPSLIVEFTATPLTPQEHDPAKGRYASNVLHQVSAAELKVADMIKLPIVLRGRADPRETIADAISWLDELVETAAKEEATTGEFVRPIMLVQAEAKSKAKPTLHAEIVETMLIDDFKVPKEHVVIATGDTKGLDGVDLFDRDCPIRFVITQQALKEGWDCSFAYVLCSVAEQKSGRAVEQLLGRILRLPRARRKHHDDLNRAYAFATTTAFQEAAKALKDGLVDNGFERIEAETLVKAMAPGAPAITGLEEGGLAYVHEEAFEPHVDLGSLAETKATIEAAVSNRVEVDLAKGTIRARGALTEYDRKALLLAMPSAAKTIDALVHKSRGAYLKPVVDVPKIPFAIPRLVVREAKGPRLFDRAHFLDTPWKLEEHDASAILAHFAPPKSSAEEAHIDVDAKGKVDVDFVDALHGQLALALAERGWTRSALVNWLDRRIPIGNRADITRTSSALFIGKALDVISTTYGLDLERLARSKFKIVEALVRTIAGHRDLREKQAFQKALFPQSGLDFATNSDLELVFEEERYGYNQPYKGGTKFKKHLFRVVGDLEATGEEYDCAVHLDNLPGLKAWVRNTVRQPHSFWLQTASDKFYPDFLALLEDGRYMAIEYKGTPYITNDDSKEKKEIGDLWAERSQGSCLFLLFGSREFSRIDAIIAAK